MAALNVTYADGDDASGMATMLGGLLEDNVRDYKGRAGITRLARGDIVLTAADRDISVTLSFRGSEVVVANGATEGVSVLAGPWLEMAKLCSGQVNPFKAMARRELTIEPRGRLDTIAAAGFVLSVPPSYYGDDEAVRRRRIGAGVAVATTIGVTVTIAYVRRRRRAA